MADLAPPHPLGDVIGKVTVGFQGWHTCDGDRSPIGGFWHWAPDRLSPVTPANCAMTSWPAMQHYPTGYTTGFAACPDGAPAQLFSDYDQATVSAHFRNMAAAEIDTVALQRFNPSGGEGPVRDVVAMMVRRAAEETGRKYYCMYDVSGWGARMRDEIKADWTGKMREYAQTPNYAHQNGKPVVCIWGFGFNDDGRNYDAATCADVIRWFKDEAGVFLIGGVPTWWRTCTSDSREGFAEVYRAFDMLSPWMVGRASKLTDLDWFYRNANKPDQDECARLGIAYQPCVMPGDLSGGVRQHGDFYWRHWYNTARLGCAGVYISMYDEYEESNQIAPTAETAAQQPADFPHPALDEDGTRCTADYYLRVTRDAGRMFKARAPTPLRPTEPWPGRGLALSARPVVLRARINGRLVCAEAGGAQPLVADREHPGPWEAFTLEYASAPGGGGGDGGAGPTRVRLRACNGRYVCADLRSDLGRPAGTLIADREQAGPWETFELEELDGGAVVLKASNGKYVHASEGGAGPLVAAGEGPWSWEQFELVEG